MNKITKDEKKALIDVRIKLIDTNIKYAKKLFKTYYKDNVKDNVKAWQKLNDKKKYKIVKQIVKWEDDAAIQYAKVLYRWNVKKIMHEVHKYKHAQLIEFGIRNDIVEAKVFDIAKYKVGKKDIGNDLAEDFDIAKYKVGKKDIGNKND